MLDNCLFLLKQTHNPKVAGSNPAPATNKFHLFSRTCTIPVRVLFSLCHLSVFDIGTFGFLNGAGLQHGGSSDKTTGRGEKYVKSFT